MALKLDNLGIPPLAGVCSYERASTPGVDVEQTVGRLKRLNYVLKRLYQLGAAHLARTPEWEAKCGLGLHLWLDAEHCTALRARVGRCASLRCIWTTCRTRVSRPRWRRSLRADDAPSCLRRLRGGAAGDRGRARHPSRADEPALRPPVVPAAAHDPARTGGDRRVGRDGAARAGARRGCERPRRALRRPREGLHRRCGRRARRRRRPASAVARAALGRHALRHRSRAPGETAASPTSTTRQR